jgi:hypothetical protein
VKTFNKGKNGGGHTMVIFTNIKGVLRLSLLTLILAFVTVTGNSVIAQQVDAEMKKKGLQVTVLLYSGRENPAFLLDDKTSFERIQDMIVRSKPRKAVKKETAIPSILGYNGVIVENLNAKVAQFPESIIVYKGILEVRNKQKKFLYDEEHKIENYLLNKAVERKVIDENTLRKIKADQ